MERFVRRIIAILITTGFPPSERSASLRGNDKKVRLNRINKKIPLTQDCFVCGTLSVPSYT